MPRRPLSPLQRTLLLLALAILAFALGAVVAAHVVPPIPNPAPLESDRA